MCNGLGDNALNLSAITRGLLVAALIALLPACSGEGPLTGSVVANDITDDPVELEAPNGTYRGGYVLVTLDADAVQRAGRYSRRTFYSAFGEFSSGASQVAGVGDQLTVGIWEATNTGLFANTQSANTAFDVVVDEDGMIFVPYVGRINVRGRPVEAIRASIQSRLADKAVEPQVVVSRVDPRSDTVVVIGAIRSSGRYPVSPAGTRVLDMIAQAGGANPPAYETTISLSRGGKTATALLEDVFADRTNNIQLAPGDRLLLRREPRSFAAFGAIRGTQTYDFGAPKLSLAEAIGRARGLDENRADSDGIFLFRYEDAMLVRSLRPDLDLDGSLYVPVVYQLSLKSAKGFFHARNFMMRDKDILYVANSLSTEFGKFVRIVQPALGNAATVTNIAE